MNTVKKNPGGWTQKDFIDRLEQLYKNNVEISKKKNADYADEDNPFKNFLVCESLGIPAEVGLVVRICDKVTRINNLLTRPAQVSDESMLDTCSDLANYSMILRMLIEYRREYILKGEDNNE